MTVITLITAWDPLVLSHKMLSQADAEHSASCILNETTGRIRPGHQGTKSLQGGCTTHPQGKLVFSSPMKYRTKQLKGEKKYLF